MVEDASREVLKDRQLSLEKSGTYAYRMNGAMENLFAEQAARATQTQNGTVYSNRAPM